MNGENHHMVALKKGELTAVPLNEVIPTNDIHGNFRPVDPDGELVKLAKTMGIYVGE